MPRYVDTVLTRFPFSQVKEHEEDVHLKKFHKFDFHYREDDEEYPWEDYKKVNDALLQTLRNRPVDLQESNLL